MHVRRIEFERFPSGEGGLRQAWLPGLLLALLMAALAAATMFPAGLPNAGVCIG